MFTKDIVNNSNFDKNLLSEIKEKLDNSQYTDAIITGIKYLTKILRDKGNFLDGDGIDLIGKLLAGEEPKLRLNNLATRSEKDEQKGIEFLLRGLYTGIRNPRTHESINDTEDYCIRILILIDTILQYLNREQKEFDISIFLDRISDLHFVSTKEYAQELVSCIPNNKISEVFSEIFNKRKELDNNNIRFIFVAIYQIMSEINISSATQLIGETLRNENDEHEIANLLSFLRPDSWIKLQRDVKLRIENLLIKSCKNGQLDLYKGLIDGDIGTFCSFLGVHFERKNDLSLILKENLSKQWNNQNYIGKYFIYSLPFLIEKNSIKKTCKNLVYATINNKAAILRENLLKACKNYPIEWKESLKIEFQNNLYLDTDYANRLLDIISENNKNISTNSNTLESEDFEKLKKLTFNLLHSFYRVFENDWEMTKDILEDSKNYISENGTFLNPEVDDESNDWGNRAGLLDDYRELLSFFRKNEYISSKEFEEEFSDLYHKERSNIVTQIINGNNL